MNINSQFMKTQNYTRERNSKPWLSSQVQAVQLIIFCSFWYSNHWDISAWPVIIWLIILGIQRSSEFHFNPLYSSLPLYYLASLPFCMFYCIYIFHKSGSYIYANTHVYTVSSILFLKIYIAIIMCCHMSVYFLLNFLHEM